MWIRRAKVALLQERAEHQQAVIRILNERVDKVERSRDLALQQVRLANAEATRLAEVVRGLQEKMADTQSNTSQRLPIDN